MTDGRCHRRTKMMGRGAEGKPCPLYAQARKALCDRSPFDATEDAGTAKPTTLPSVLAALLSKHSDGRRKQKKSHGDATHKKSPPSAPSTVWDVTEDYFRPLNLADMDVLVPAVPFGPDTCLSIPILGKKAPTLDTGIAELSSSSALVAEEELAHANGNANANANEVVVVVAAQEEEMKEVENNTESVDEEITLKIDEAGAENESTSMSWLLGSKHRFVLTSERPNKKRRLLGREAGLDQLLRLPYPNAEIPEPCCDVCCLGPSSAASNQFLHCDACKVSVHRRCYDVRDVPRGAWLCSWCKQLEKDSLPCVLCSRGGGALKPLAMDAGGKPCDGNAVKFAHLFCSMWAPEVYVEDTRAMEPVLNVGGVHQTRRKLVCYLCKVKHGVCVRCSHGTCRTSFHPLCARESKHQMEIWGKFGIDNVELRAFCSKHSSSHDINTGKHSEKFRMNVDDISPIANPPSVLPLNKLPKFRLSRSTRDKSMAQSETTSSESVVQNENTLEQNCEAQLVKDIDTHGVNGNGNNITHSPNLALFLRKLIDRGKINVNDVASEIGISSNSLEAALLGETTSFSPGLRLKIMRWLQDSAHILRIRSGSAIPSANGVVKVDCTNADEVIDPLVDVKVAGLECPDAAVVKSLPPRRRPKGNTRINKTTCPSAVTVTQQNDIRKLVDENGEIPVVLTEDMKGEFNDIKASLHNQGAINGGLELSETILEDTTKPVDSSSSLALLPGLKGNSVELDCSDLSEAQHQPPSTTERVSSFESGIDQVDEANITAPHILEKGCFGSPDCDIDVVVSSGQPDFIVGESCSSYVHPFIQERLMQVQGHAVSKQNHGEAYSNEVDTLVGVDCEHPYLHSSCTDKHDALDVTKLDQLAKAKNVGVLELSPEDEIEEELLYLQSRLLDKVVAIKHNCEGLIFRVVQDLPQELDALNKRRWDLIVVSQFLCEVREAKKRGRKERKHKEAQAVLAAAVAAASARNSSLRKDVNDDIISTHQESPLKVSAASGRARLSSPLASQTKESSRTAVAKVSPDKPSGFFQLPDFPQENALSCDVCRRTETLLNRIFVCSCCKVAVHLDCYRRLKNPIVTWKCEFCEEIASMSRSPRNETVDGRGSHYVDAHCGLCGGADGAFRKSSDGQWVHAFCAEWLLEASYKRGQQNPVEGMDTISKEKNLHCCCLCQRSVGACLKCSYGHCQITFHPSCARSAGLYMNVKSIGGRLQHKAYCEKHSSDQREADSQQQGSEELKTIKQIRVELEKARLLCERIIKREKLKRDLVLCSHEILASRRDCVAFSVLVRSSFFPPGVSSESATTSINDLSYSGTIQRSDDVTMDSTTSGRRAVRFSMHTDADRKTDDTSTSRPSFKRKLSDRTSFAGKQLPHRPASAALWNLSEDGEKRAKSRKHTETFQKELVMTSDQASMQNQRLPKGFVYVPVGCLSKEKLVDCDMECEPQEPGG